MFGDFIFDFRCVPTSSPEGCALWTTSSAWYGSFGRQEVFVVNCVLVGGGYVGKHRKKLAGGKPENPIKMDDLGYP